MKRIGIVVVVLASVIVVGCGSQSEASSESAVHVESMDKLQDFNVTKIVDKESGCKYLVTKERSYGFINTTQMLDIDGSRFAINNLL